MSSPNNMTLLLNKIENRLGLTLLLKHLPPELKKEAWADKVIMSDSIVLFSRYFPNKFRFTVNEETCDKRVGNGEENSISHGSNKDRTVWYYIKDYITQNLKILGCLDIDWLDYSGDNIGFSGSVGQNMYYPTAPCIEGTVNTVLGLQMNADIASLYNNDIYVDFEYPNKLSVRGLANTIYDLRSFTIILLVEHVDLSTISPTKMNLFEDLCVAQVANFLFANLKYYDGIETSYLNIDLKLNELQEAANRLPEIIQKFDDSWVSASNDNAPYIFSV